MNDEARQRALKILERRDVSRKMLLDKLTEKGISNTDAEEVADWLCGLGVVNDERFASLVVRHYAAKGYGKRRICDELYRRGIDRELWDPALDELPETDDTVSVNRAEQLLTPSDVEQTVVQQPCVQLLAQELLFYLSQKSFFLWCEFFVHIIPPICSALFERKKSAGLGS